MNTTTHLLLLMFWFAVWGFIALRPDAGWMSPAALGFGVLWALWVWRESARRERLVKRAQSDVSALFGGRSTTLARFSSTYAYGAVDISPDHCVFWILLDAEPQHLPAYLSVDKLHTVEDEALREWLKELSDEALAVFFVNGWRRYWPLPKIGFESTRRASWQHFK